MEGLGFVGCPFYLAVELTGGCEDGQFAKASAAPRFVSQIAIERPGIIARGRYGGEGYRWDL
jgi:hypothetical protein